MGDTKKSQAWKDALEGFNLGCDGNTTKFDALVGEAEKNGDMARARNLRIAGILRILGTVYLFKLNISPMMV